MADLLIPQKDNSSTRKAEIEETAKFYRYNNDAGIPLIEEEGERDKADANWTIKTFRILIAIRANVGTVVKESGLKFEKELVQRDVRNLVSMLKAGKSPVDYYSPDLGVVAEGNRPKSIEEYTSKVFIKEKPPSIAARFDSDEQFAYTFLAGPNPNQIKRMNAIPANFPISNTQFQSLPEFAGDDLGRAMAEGRVYYVDHSGMQILKNGKHPQGPKYQYAPFAAFAVPRNAGAKQRLYPFAIQCGPTPEGREIYTPKDGYTWKIARNCVLSSHNNHHEVVTHLGLTHLLVDAAVAATRRNLHVNHPIHALLHPHFEGTVKINVGARTDLIQPGASVDRLVGSDMNDNYKLLVQERLAYSFRDNYLPTRLKRLQTDDTKIISNYPYRDDGILIWNAIFNWVSDYVGLFYKSDADVRGDAELQAWAKEANTVGKIRDFGVSPGSVKDRNDLIEICTMIMFTAGPQHAAVNFTQDSEMLFVPANPLAGYTPEPKGRGHTMQDWIDNFPPLDVAVHTYGILKMLAGVNHTQLGLYGMDLKNNAMVAIQQAKFAAKLAEIELTIMNRNRSRVEYVHLKPSRIPASINI